MKILVATNQTQGYRPTDICETDEGELLMPSLPCNHIVCKCDYSMSGMTSRKATTTFKVVDSPLTNQEFIDRYLAAIQDAGLLSEDVRGKFIKQAVHLLAVAGTFRVDDVVEYYGGQYHLRILAPSSLHPIEMISGKISKGFVIALTANTTLTQLILSDNNFEKWHIAMIEGSAAQTGTCRVEWQNQAQTTAPTSSSTRPDLYDHELAKMMRDVNQVELDLSHVQLF